MRQKHRIDWLEEQVETNRALIKLLLTALESTASPTRDRVVKHELQKIMAAWDEMEKKDVEKKDG